jgi:hypothetical protein
MGDTKILVGTGYGKRDATTWKRSARSGMRLRNMCEDVGKPWSSRIVEAYGDYTTNLPLQDLRNGLRGSRSDSRGAAGLEGRVQDRLE